MKSGRLSLLLFIQFLPGMAWGYGHSSQDAAALFVKGNTEYQKSDYASAESCYRQILDSGIDSGSLYYNLGNACFKQKRLGDAIYYWEKAQQKLPTDQEIRENLELANLLLVDRIEIPVDPLPLKVLTAIPTLFTIRQEGLLILALFVAANLLFSIYLLSAKPGPAFRAFVGCSAIGLLFVVFACSFCWKVYERDYRKKGIVIEQKVDVRSGPGTENITVFTVHEGIKVRVHGYSNGWYQISLPNGWNGWLRQNYLRVL